MGNEALNLFNVSGHLLRSHPMAKLQIMVLALEGILGLLVLIMLLARAVRYWRSRH